ncbi:MAG: hypothetical protein AABZ07_04420, partial [Nitrospirota bacterium]
MFKKIYYTLWITILFGLSLPDLSSAQYCPSYGGSQRYESIQNITYSQKPGGTLATITYIYIANPTGCTSGNPCPEYDNSPEYINAWIDWND